MRHRAHLAQRLSKDDIRLQIHQELLAQPGTYADLYKSQLDTEVAKGGA